MASRKRRKVFDKAYYERFYHDPNTRVTTEDEMERLGNFVCSYLEHLDVEIKSVLDLGCGIGAWKEVIAEHYPDAAYTGVEISEYLCRKYGWKPGSAADFRSTKRFDLVICQGVLQYLPDREAVKAISNLDELCRNALFLEVLTRDDWEKHCDQSVTDGHCYLREASWYTTRLYRRFTNCGGGIFLSNRYDHYIYALDRLGL